MTDHRTTETARLIDAAPDVLAALEQAVATGACWRGISDAYAAIAKARGVPLVSVVRH